MGHVSGRSEMRELKSVYMKDLVSRKVHAVCIVHSGLAQANILKTPRPKGARVFRGKLYMHDT